MNLRHVARLAQLSPSAVSLALRNSPKISEATKKKVRKLAEKVGYRPDAKVVEMMTQLRKPRGVRQQACFGVISFYPERHPWETSRHLAEVYAGMKRRAGELGPRRRATRTSLGSGAHRSTGSGRYHRASGRCRTSCG